MDTKAAFDREAFAKEHGMTMEFVNWFFDKKAAGCGQVWFMMAAAMWEGWKASRAAIEISPEHVETLVATCQHLIEREGYSEHSANLRLIAKLALPMLTSHGIRIEGKTE